MMRLALIEDVDRGATLRALLDGRRVTVIGGGRDAAIAEKTLEALGARVRVEPPTTDVDVTDSALVVVTAASARRAPAVQAATAAGVALLGGLDVAWLASGADAFAVSGGAHAARAVELVAMLLAAHDHAAIAVDGAARAAGDGDVLLVQPSLDQLSTMQVFRPRIAVVLRDATPHALRLFARQTARDCLVITNDPAVRAFARVSPAHVVWLSTEHALEHGVYVEGGRIAARLNGVVEEVCPATGIPATSLEATLAAVACGLWAGLDPLAMGTTLLRGDAFERDVTDPRAMISAAVRGARAT